MRGQLGNRSCGEATTFRMCSEVASSGGFVFERFTDTRGNFTRVNTFTFTHDLSYIASILFANVYFTHVRT